MVLDSITIEVFERKWTEYIARYNLHTRTWFNKLYFEKEKLVPVYLDVYFWVGMLSMQRSEGMHAFFDGYITRQSTLRMFVHQYELAIRAKLEKELEAEYRSKGFQIVCELMFKWEEQAIQCYTRTVYEFFKPQLRKWYHCEVSSRGDHQFVPGVEKFILQRFESRGILCCHILKILSHKKIDKIDESWPNMTPEHKTYRSMLKYFAMACDIALCTSVKVQYVKHNLKKMVHDLQNWEDEMIVPNPNKDDSDKTEGTTLRYP
ncbi:PREDICTED: protein FAR1-RELATED SEQUENCE 5-like [Nicotiana attenuata]|uniref:protein FAR1-RELATED SEQUENCE 5-like n=1 Tax=Nicotiana attenuata TaxID=49451 RepID=UPI0009057A34|nr:PREDICTED: protein FAR1-RELATED SEQUENCE 5-like [Nicotiana attenuata]